jgi:hypothetical protein
MFPTLLFGPVLHPEYKNPWQDITPEELVQIISPIQLVAVVFWPLQGVCSATLCPSATFMSRRESLLWVLKETIFGVP